MTRQLHYGDRLEWDKKKLKKALKDLEDPTSEVSLRLAAAQKEAFAECSQLMEEMERPRIIENFFIRSCDPADRQFTDGVSRPISTEPYR